VLNLEATRKGIESLRTSESLDNREVVSESVPERVLSHGRIRVSVNVGQLRFQSSFHAETGSTSFAYFVNLSLLERLERIAHNWEACGKAC